MDNKFFVGFMDLQMIVSKCFPTKVLKIMIDVSLDKYDEVKI